MSCVTQKHQRHCVTSTTKNDRYKTIRYSCLMFVLCHYDKKMLQFLNYLHLPFCRILPSMSKVLYYPPSPITSWIGTVRTNQIFVKYRANQSEHHLIIPIISTLHSSINQRASFFQTDTDTERVKERENKDG